MVAHTEANGVDETHQFMNNKDVKPSCKKFEDLIDDIGGFGCWQRVIYFIIYVAEIFGAFGMLAPVIIGAVPKWRCTAWFNSTGETVYNNRTNVNESDYFQCHKDGMTCAKYTYEDEFTSIVSEWDLVCDKSYASDLINSVQMVGLLLGAASCGQFSDLFGRKKMYYVTTLILTAGGILSGVSNRWQLYTACRFMVGFGFGGNMVVMCVYPIEFLGRKYRVLCGTVGFWAVGTIIIAGLGYLIREWRTLIIVSSSIGIAYFFTWWLMDESPRWLLQQGRLEESEAVLKKIARRNGTKAPDIATLKAVAHSDQQEDEAKKYTYIDLFKSRVYLKRAIILFLTWFTTFVIYYELSYNLKNFSGDRYFNLVMAGLIDWAALLTVIPSYHYLGRRLGLACYLSVAGACLIAVLVIILTGSDKVYPGLLLAFALVGKSSGLCGTYAVMIYSAEIYPTVIRNVGVGTGCIAARLGGIVAPQIVFLGTVYLSAPYIICITLVAVALPTLFLLPETKGAPLEDSLETKPAEKAALV